MSEYIYQSHGEPLVNERGEIYLARAGEIVRCRDCVWFTNSSHYGAYCTNFGSPLGDDYDGFCAWGERANFATCECGEDIELGNRESAVCPRCNRTVIA